MRKKNTPIHFRKQAKEVSSVMNLQKRRHSMSACNLVRDERMDILYFKKKEPKYGSIGASKSREF